MSDTSVKFPLEFDGPGKGYSTIKGGDFVQLSKFNIKNVLLTAPGERLWLADFGVGLRNYLFEFPSEELVETLQRTIAYQVAQYVPFVDISKIDIAFPDEHILSVSISYSIPDLGLNDVIDVTVQE